MDPIWKRRGGRPVPGPGGASCRVLIAGDTHGNLDWIGSLTKMAARYGCDGIVQLGDFGMWPDQRVRRRQMEVVPNDGWMDAVAERCAHHGVWLRFLDGNHDFHPGYRRAYPEVADDGVRPIRHELVDWADRGSVWTWCGVKFGAVGGSISIDRSMRKQGWSYWPTEHSTPADVDALVERAGPGGVDILLTHDSPVLPDGITPLPPTPGDLHLPADCATNIGIIGDAVGRVQPDLVVHGHYHHRWSRTIGDLGIEGLASDLEAARHGASWAMLELDDGHWTWIEPAQLDTRRRAADELTRLSQQLDLDY